MNRRKQLQLIQLAVLTGAWLLVGLFMTLYDHLVLYTNNSQGPQESYSFLLSLAQNCGSAVIGALLGGSFLIFFINEKFQDKSYMYTIAAVSLSFMVVILFIISILGLVTIPLKTSKPITDPVSIEAFKDFFLDTSRIKNTMAWFIVVTLTQLLLQISIRFGQGTFGNIILGKYYTPKEEEKIFMFLDINSSTHIAEELGDEKYHKLLKDFFADITNPIVNNKGEIYQYVGDEVIVRWNYDDGIKNSHCIRCFYDIKVCIEKGKDKYLQRYGFIPSFKAGIHSGKVVAGEVGIIKRDVTYSGDVLNTTSRIQSMCNQFHAEVIASSDVLVGLPLTDQFTAEPLGAIKLRGKEKEIVLSALKPVAA